MRENRTKIIATLGPSSDSATTLLKMIGAGMDCVRLNFSHGSHAEYAKTIKTIRRVSKKAGREIAIIQDLQGGRLRLGAIANGGVVLKKGHIVVLGRGGLPLSHKTLPRFLKKNERVFIDNGAIELKVVRVSRESAVCAVVASGVVSSNKGINLPDSDFEIPALSEKDKKDILFGLKHGVDYIALSFVKSAKEIETVKKYLKQKSSAVPNVIAKIERKEALKNLDEITAAADAVMVARGDLGIELPAETVPIHQKKIVECARARGKPVIIATQMLTSMIENRRPTRAEISDVATAIFESADALLVSNETAVGAHPVEVVKTLAQVATSIERELQKEASRGGAARAAAKGAAHAYLIAVVARSIEGVLKIVKSRPLTPIVVFAESTALARKLSLVWGVQKVFVQKISVKNPLPAVRKILRAASFLKRAGPHRTRVEVAVETRARGSQTAATLLPTLL